MSEGQSLIHQPWLPIEAIRFGCFVAQFGFEELAIEVGFAYHPASQRNHMDCSLLYSFRSIVERMKMLNRKLPAVYEFELETVPSIRFYRIFL